MTLLGPRRLDAERMDAPVLPPATLDASLAHVAAVNRWLGGELSLRRHLAPLRGRPVTVLDVGTGDGAVLRRLVLWAGRAGGEWRGVGVDLHPQVLSAASARPDEGTRVRLVRGNGLALPFADASFDVVLCTLTLHHTDEQDAPRLLSEMARVARALVLVSDLERHVLSYLSALFLARTWWRGNELTRSDGPHSVLRSFTPAELEAVGRRAGLDGLRVRRHFPFRLVLEARP